MAVLPIDPDGAALRALRSAGLRVTMSRLAMLTWLAEHPHCTADDIGAGVRGQLGPVSTQAIYDMLAACTGGAPDAQLMWTQAGNRVPPDLLGRA
jgi:hypothetical protein